MTIRAGKRHRGCKGKWLCVMVNTSTDRKGRLLFRYVYQCAVCMAGHARRPTRREGA